MGYEKPPPIDANALADEIEKRQLKFADNRLGEFEMPSIDEHVLICKALREYKKVPK